MSIPGQQNLLSLDSDGERIPLFVPHVEPEIDLNPFVIEVPDADYGMYSINKKVDNIDISHILPIEKGLVISAVNRDKNIFFLNKSGDLFSINEEGEKVWQTTIVETNSYAEIFNIGDILIVNTGTTRLYGINPENGDVVWKKSLKAPIHSGSAAVSKDKFAMITIDNYVYVLNSQDGTLHWSYKAASPTLKKVNLSSPVYYNGMLILPPIEDVLIFLDARSGDKLWSQDIDTTYRESVFYNLDDTPVILGNVIIASNNMGKIEAFEVDSRKKKWEQYLSFKGKPYITNDFIFTLTENNKFIGLNSDGKIKWSSSLNGGFDYYGPLLINGSLWLFTNKGKAIEYNVKTGEEINSVSIPEGIYYTPLVLNGKLYSFAKNKELVIIGGQEE